MSRNKYPLKVIKFIARIKYTLYSEKAVRYIKAVERFLQ